MYLYVNGKIVKKSDARISPFDHGFLYGVGLFETFRIYDGHPFLLDDHLMRLQTSLEDLQIDFEIKRNELTDILTDLLKANGLKNAYVRLNVSAGEGELGLSADSYQTPSLLLFMKEIPVTLAEKSAVLLKINRNTPEGETRLKSHHFLNNIYGKREIGNNPQMEGIFRTKEGYLAEGITSNIFWVKGNMLFTPAIQTGILNGVTRAFVIEIAKGLGIEIKEGFFQAEELLTSDEAFITNSIQGIVPLSKIEGVTLPRNQITKNLQHKYNQYRTSLWSRDELHKGVE
ncbi:aminodeoxychorismate lyase [Fredinandcohnia sp. 179-A 10B2 NHS]|uniref:aminodeoxychorismate lyase n=1 Tax=Fredinandcohnia sp. 179-A 10B2 NHS TaxID=3235176 RepID=UPI0039A22528